MEKNLTTGSVLKNVVYFSRPYLFSYFLQTLYGMADLFIIGQYEGVASTTAVSIGSQVMHMLTVIIVGLAMADPVVALFTDTSNASGVEVVRLGGQYMRGYVWDCVFVGVHFSFSGYFCACGKSILSFLHNILAITLVRIPGAYLTSMHFPDTLYPMGLSSAAGSLLSAIICVIAYTIITKKEIKNQETAYGIQ